MCTQMNENELRNAVNEFKGKARNFYAIAKSQVELPFDELFFVETTAAAYELLKSGKKVDGIKVIMLAVNKIMAKNPLYSRVKVYRKCKAVFDANRNGCDFSWKHYCEQYFKRIYPQNAEELKSKMWGLVWNYDKQLTTHSADDFANVVFASCII